MKFILEERFILYEDVINWEKKYAKCKTKEDCSKFWQEYYPTVWGEAHAEAIKNIGIESCLQKYGWTFAENPFLNFLKTIANTPKNRVGLTTITRVDFKMLTTAFERKLLTAKDLADGGKYGDYNLIYNPYLYTSIASSENQLEYLHIQQAFKNSVDLEGKKIGESDLGIAFANFYSATGNTENLKSRINPGAKLRDLRRLERLASRLIPEFKSNKRDKATDTKVTALLDSVKPETAAIFFVSAFDTFEILESGGIALADQEIAGTPNLTTYRASLTGIDHNKVKEAGKQLNIKPNSYNDRLAAQLLIGLAKKAGAGIKLKTEDAGT